MKSKLRYSYILILSLFMHGITYAQSDLVYLEYFFDVDPGFGSGIEISFPQSTTLDINIDIPHGLSPGTHILGVRVRNNDGDWGFTERRPFTITESPVVDPPIEEIVYAEYFIDVDPGQGSGSSLGVSTGLDFDINRTIVANTLPSGFHILGVRAQDAAGSWGFTEFRPFVKSTDPSTDPPIQLITAIEYFFDVDPGVGSGIEISDFSSSTQIDIDRIVTQSLTVGTHILGVRAKYADGSWGFAERRPVVINESIASGSTPLIVGLEYFFNYSGDPGVGQATFVPVTPALEIDLDPALLATPADIPEGTNTIGVRILNDAGGWGLTEFADFDVLDDCTQPVPLFNAAIACAGEEITFQDLSSDLQPDATYEWDLDGDGFVDNTTTGDVTFTYNLPGTYTPRLRIQQGQICDQFYEETITIIAKPVILFSVQGNEVGEEVTFELESANLPSSPTFSWDFDDDGLEDSSDPGPQLTYTYVLEGSYDPVVTVTDGNGCSDEYTRNLAIIDSGAGGGGGPIQGTPEARFTTNIVCEGTATSFIDQSENIPLDATYNWEFGDGATSTTIGSAVHTYFSPGSYTARLTIDIPGSGTEVFENNVEVVSIPNTRFEVSTTCVSQNVSFVDTSTKVNGTSVYAWDFNNDGIIDSDLKGVAEFKFDQPGDYVSRLTINNGNGCVSFFTTSVKVLQEPVADFSFETACVNEEVSFTNLSSAIEGGAIYSWDLDGDGLEDSNAENGVVFTYDTPGSYDIILKVLNDDFCVNDKILTIVVPERPIAEFEVVARCYGQESQIMDMSQNVDANSIYSWDFDGDGIVDSDTQGDTIFTYPEFASYIAKLTIDNGLGCISESEYLVVFKDAALPDYTVSPACQGQETVFTDLSTQLETGSIYSWDFDGDGIEDSANPGSVAFTYQSAGIFTSRLTIDNGNQCLAFKEVSVEVTLPPEVSTSDIALCDERPETLDPGSGYETYLWSTGETTQTITVDTFGDYIVQVSDIKGCINRDTISVQLREDPVADFDFQVRLSPVEGFVVSFINKSTDSLTYVWDFGIESENPPINAENPVFAYNEFYLFYGSTYQVCLTVINECGATATICKDIFLSPTGVEEDEIDGFRVFPNPNDGKFTAVLEDINFNRMAIFSNDGKILWDRKEYFSYADINISDHGKGIYFIYLERDDEAHIKRIVIE